MGEFGCVGLFGPWPGFAGGLLGLLGGLLGLAGFDGSLFCGFAGSWLFVGGLLGSAGLLGPFGEGLVGSYFLGGGLLGSAGFEVSFLGGSAFCPAGTGPLGIGVPFLLQSL